MKHQMNAKKALQFIVGKSAPRAILLGVACLPACYWTPTENERLEDAVVVSSRDPAVDLGAFRTFFVRPDIRILEEANGIPGTSDSEVVPDPIAAPLLSATRSNLLGRGYTEAASSDDAELAVDLVYVRGVQSAYYCTYWGDWAYWGYPGWSYYFPYPCGTSEWHSGMLTTHIVDLAAAQAESAAEPGTAGIVRGVWFSAVYGAEVESVSFVTARAVDGIDEAFAQSPYLSRTPGAELAPGTQVP
jgi:hypothetical protein